MNNKPKIYIVDDDFSVCKALSRLMNSAGFTSETFNSAQSFLDSVPSHSKGILILDVCMPAVDGFELQAKLNAVSSSLYTIFITAHAQPGDGDRALKAGAKGFLHKPFSDEELLNLIYSLAENIDWNTGLKKGGGENAAS